MHKNKYSLIIFSLTLISLFPCCSANINKSQQKFGNDADYYLGLRFLSENKENEAKQKFLSCKKNGSYYCARRSAEELTKIGTVQEKNKACEELVQLYNDEDAILIATKQYYQAGEIGKIINLTDKIDYKTSNNEIIKYRLFAENKQENSHFEKDILSWFISRPVSDIHYKYYRDEYELPDEIKDYSDTDLLISFRIDVYRKNYSLAYDKIKKIFELMEKPEIQMQPLLISDIGKTYLYASSRYTQNAQTFCSLAEKNKGSNCEFYFWFYAARFYEKAQSISNAKECFKKSIASAKEPHLKDNAIWYILNTKITEAYKPTIKNLSDYASQWSDKDYFDDFFDKLIPSLLANQDYKYIKYLLEQTQDYASDEVVSKLSYIYARLLQEGLISVNNKDEEIQKALNRALNCGTNVYYKIMAAYALGYSDFQIEELLCQTPVAPQIQIDENAEQLLRGYVYFGFPEKIYNEWNTFYKKSISTQTSMELADFLNKCGRDNPDYYPLSIRIAARSANISDRPLTKDELKLIYPEDFADLVQKYAEEYNFEESVLFSLIRTESFFDSDVTSTAGAIGLTQLMELTGVDIASRLKIKDYELTDPETNIKFGTYYLTQLYKRCDYSYLNAFFSYNAGITRVRRWLKTSKIGVKGKDKNTQDLFLETIPYSETREYGRKLVSASVYYELLYTDRQKNENSTIFKETIEKLMQ